MQKHNKELNLDTAKDPTAEEHHQHELQVLSVGIAETAAELEDIKDRKKAVQARHDELARAYSGLLRRGPDELPLFDGDKNKKKTNDEWKQWGVERLSDRDEWLAIAKILREKNEIATIGALQEFVTRKGDFWAKDLDGVGPKKAEVIDEVNFRFWADHPEFCGEQKTDAAKEDPDHDGKTIELLTTFTRDDGGSSIEPGPYDVVGFTIGGEPVILLDVGETFVIPNNSAWRLAERRPIDVQLLIEIKADDEVVFAVGDEATSIEASQVSDRGVISYEHSDDCLYELPFHAWKGLTWDES